jgi:plasmid stabilization system protein ParE
MLGMWPLSGRSLHRRRTRYFPIPRTKYSLLYRIDTEQVSILLVVHGAMNWRTLAT